MLNGFLKLNNWPLFHTYRVLIWQWCVCCSVESPESFVAYSREFWDFTELYRKSTTPLREITFQRISLRENAIVSIAVWHVAPFSRKKTSFTSTLASCGYNARNNYRTEHAFWQYRLMISTCCVFLHDGMPTTNGHGG